MGRYVLSVICASLVCGTMISLFKDRAGCAVVKLLCGAFLAYTVLSPLAGLNLERELGKMLPDSLDAACFTSAGENMAHDALRDIIKQETETYILDKATALHAELRVQVTLCDEDPPVPVAAVLSGNVSPYARGELERILQTDLGIPKENVRWTG